MPFATIKSREMKEFKKTAFMNLDQGQYTIRILDAEAATEFSHYINNTTVKCLDDDCPQCEQNKSLISQYPKDFRDQKGYVSRTQKFLVNIMDLTPVKVCPQCQAENVKSANQCSACETLITEVKPAPSNKIKVLSRGVKLFDQFNTAEAYLNGLEDEQLKLTDVAIVINVSGQGKNKVPTAIPTSKKLGPLPEGLELYDTKTVSLTLTRPEFIKVMEGVSLKDVLASRQAKVDIAEVDKFIEQEALAAAASVDDRVAALFDGKPPF
jgi:hypothetical protein